MTKEETIKKIGEKIKGSRSAMLITQNDQEFRGRLMATQDIEFDGTLWFMTSNDSNKVTEIKANPNVHIAYGDGKVAFVSLYGTAELVRDQARIKEFWNEFYKAWFENEDDPRIILIKVTIKNGEYWDNKAGSIGAIADMAIGAITGKTNTLDENEKFEL